jgi:hypothetical protein
MSGNLQTMSNEAAEGTVFQAVMQHKPFAVFNRKSQIMVSLNLYDANKPRLDIRLLSQPSGSKGSMVATRCGAWMNPDYGQDLILAVEKCLEKLAELEDLPATTRPRKLRPRPPLPPASDSSSHEEGEIY